MNEELRAFLQNLREFFVYYVERRFDVDVFPAEIAEELGRAWPEVDARIESVRADLADADETIMARLDAVGLTGPSLALKWRGFGRAFDEWRKRQERRWRNRVLRWSNTLLGSIAAVIPPAHAIKEFKESIEHGVREAEEDTEGLTG